MWEANVRTTVSAIIASLLQVRPNCESMLSTVGDLAAEVGRQNLPRLVEPGDPTPMMNHKACDVWTELESLETALSDRNVPKALEHAEAALRVVG